MWKSCDSAAVTNRIESTANAATLGKREEKRNTQPTEAMPPSSAFMLDEVEVPLRHPNRHPRSHPTPIKQATLLLYPVFCDCGN